MVLLNIMHPLFLSLASSVTVTKMLTFHLNNQSVHKFNTQNM